MKIPGKSGIGSSGPKSSSSYKVMCTACDRIMGSVQLERISINHSRGYRMRCPFCREFDCIDTPIETINLLSQMLVIQNAFKSAWVNSPTPIKIKQCPICEEEGTAQWWRVHTNNGCACKTTGQKIPVDIRNMADVRNAPIIMNFRHMAEEIRKKYKKANPGDEKPE